MRHRGCSTVAPDWSRRGVRRARPLLGTLVTLQLEAVEGGPAADALNAAADAALACIAHIGAVMSAHDPASDLGRLARAAPGTTLALDPHTVRVLLAARHWQRASRGAFDPAAAARRLALAGLRPAFAPRSDPMPGGDLNSLRFVDERRVVATAPTALDLGGIAKGYAVDLAVRTLRERGVASGLVNAGGDLRAFGLRHWPVELRCRGPQKPGAAATAQPPRELHDAALATSQTGTQGSEFIETARIMARGRRQHDSSSCCTVRAPDCMSADALTKWALQAAVGSTRLARALRTHRAGLWRAS